MKEEMYWTMFIWIGMFLGSVLGSAVAVKYFDVDYLSVYSLMAGTVGSFVGIGLGYKFTQWVNSLL